MPIVIQEDCIGLVINPTLINPVTSDVIDLTDADVITFRFLAPEEGADPIEVAGSIDGDPTLGKVIFANTDDELFSAGNWKYQVKVHFTTGQLFYSTISKIKVKSNLGIT